MSMPSLCWGKPWLRETEQGQPGRGQDWPALAAWERRGDFWSGAALVKDWQVPKVLQAGRTGFTKLHFW